MKKYYILILTIFLLILTACTNMPIKTRVLSKTENIVKIEASQIVSLENNGVQLIIKNLTDKVLEIDWNSSSLDGDNIIISGQSYIQKNTLLPKTVIAPFSKAVKVINKTTNIEYFMGEWEENSLELPCKLVLHITVEDKKQYVVIDLLEKIR